MIKKVKSITIFGNKFKVIYDPTNNGGSFSFVTETFVIGTKCMKHDPVYTLSVISHEVMEAIYECMGARYCSPREHNAYLFNFNHQTFENAIQIHTEIMSKFYDTK